MRYVTEDWLYLKKLQTNKQKTPNDKPKPTKQQRENQIKTPSVTLLTKNGEKQSPKSLVCVCSGEILKTKQTIKQNPPQTANHELWENICAYFVK